MHAIKLACSLLDRKHSVRKQIKTRAEALDGLRCFHNAYSSVQSLYQRAFLSSGSAVLIGWSWQLHADSSYTSVLPPAT